MSQLALKFDPAEETGWYYICHKCGFKGPHKDFKFRDEDYGWHGTREIIICPKCGADSDDRGPDNLPMVWFLEFVDWKTQ